MVNSTHYEESWHRARRALQERLEVYKTPLTREEEGLRFQIKHVSNRDVRARDRARAALVVVEATPFDRLKTPRVVARASTRLL